jgi:hypothetical protein
MKNLLDKYGMLQWGDTTVYKNRDGEVIPEIWDMMAAIKLYYRERGKRGQTSNSPYDIG